MDNTLNMKTTEPIDLTQTAMEALVNLDFLPEKMTFTGMFLNEQLYQARRTDMQQYFDESPLWRKLYNLSLPHAEAEGYGGKALLDLFNAARLLATFASEKYPSEELAQWVNPKSAVLGNMIDGASIIRLVLYAVLTLRRDNEVHIMDFLHDMKPTLDRLPGYAQEFYTFIEKEQEHDHEYDIDLHPTPCPPHLLKGDRYDWSFATCAFHPGVIGELARRYDDVDDRLAFIDRVVECGSEWAGEDVRPLLKELGEELIEMPQGIWQDLMAYIVPQHFHLDEFLQQMGELRHELGGGGDVTNGDAPTGDSPTDRQSDYEPMSDAEIIEEEDDALPYELADRAHLLRLNRCREQGWLDDAFRPVTTPIALTRRPLTMPQKATIAVAISWLKEGDETPWKVIGDYWGINKETLRKGLSEDTAPAREFKLEVMRLFPQLPREKLLLKRRK